MIAIDCPYGFYFDTDGKPLTGGKMYFGQPGLDPIANPIPTYFDAAGSSPTGPYVETQNGYPVRSGTPTLIYTAQAYSLKVVNLKGKQVYFLADSSTLPSNFAIQLASAVSAMTGAGLVGYNQLMPYLAPSAGYRMRETFTARNAQCDNQLGDVYGLLSAAIAAANTVGADFEFTAGQTYRLGASLTFPAGMTVRTKGCTFEDLTGTTSATPLISVPDFCSFDQINISIPAGIKRRRAIVITGDSTRFYGDVVVTSVDQQTASVNDDAAVRFSGSSKGALGGTVRVTNYDNPLQFLDSDHFEGNVELVGFVRGILVEDSSHIKLHGHIHTASPNAAYSPGHVGVLLQCNTAGATHHITLSGMVVEDAGEHGGRCAGPEEIHFLDVDGFHARNCGGCGFKVLGTDAGAPTNANRHLRFNKVTAEDCGTGGLTDNMCGLLIMFAEDVEITGFRCIRTDKLQSAFYGIRYAVVSDMTIDGYYIAEATRDGIFEDNSLGDNSRVTIGKGLCYLNGRAGFYTTGVAAMTARRTVIDGLVADSNTTYGAVVILGAGTYVGCKANILAFGNGTGPVFCDSVAWAWNGSGVVPGVPAWIAADGSLFQDEGNNTFVMKATVWTAVA